MGMGEKEIGKVGRQALNWGKRCQLDGMVSINMEKTGEHNTRDINQIKNGGRKYTSNRENREQKRWAETLIKQGSGGKGKKGGKKNSCRRGTTKRKDQTTPWGGGISVLTKQVQKSNKKNGRKEKLKDAHCGGREKTRGEVDLQIVRKRERKIVKPKKKKGKKGTTGSERGVRPHDRRGSHSSRARRRLKIPTSLGEGKKKKSPNGQQKTKG